MTNQSAPSRPEWLRLPKNGQRCSFSGLSRSFLYGLIERGEVKTVSLRDRNKARGVRLISADSLTEWIAKHAEGGAK